MKALYVQKRSGKIDLWNPLAIHRAVHACYQSLSHPIPEGMIARILDDVEHYMIDRWSSVTKTEQTGLIHVETIQDIVERCMIRSGEHEAMRAYRAYRTERSIARTMHEHQPATPAPVASPTVPRHVAQTFNDSAAYFPTALQQFQFFDKYSRFNYALGRRDTWIETVDRTVTFLKKLSGNALDSTVYDDIRSGILAMDVMPSMRLLAMAGPAAERNHIALYNCSYMPVDSLASFSEALLISMSGCGVGFSVESSWVDQLPDVEPWKSGRPGMIIVKDTTEGWCDALTQAMEHWFSGHDLLFDMSHIRPAGAPLLTKGGRSSGPEPFLKCLNTIREIIHPSATRRSRGVWRLRPIDCHDIMCAVGSAAVSGGVRRTAMISLFDYDDHEMRRAKDGVRIAEHPMRWNANNSVVWHAQSTPDHQRAFAEDFMEMVRGNTGEPGIFSRTTANAMRPLGREGAAFGTNPCGEIVLRPWQFCNLTAAIARPNDTPMSLTRKVELATIIGTIQSMATHFPGLRPMWRKNCEEERLLGVDITGQMDCPLLRNEWHTGALMGQLRDHVHQTNIATAQKLAINPSAAMTCVKPSGNSSVLLNCSSGLHARHSAYYIRNVRVSSHSPIFRVLRDAGVPMDPENGQTREHATTWVVHFPVKSPEGAITRDHETAIDQCERWLRNKRYWTDHNPSCTITYRPDEVIDLMAWVWKHRSYIGGLSFLPSFDASYDQMPYEACDEATYEAAAAAFPPLDWSRIWLYEDHDLTNAAQELACVAGACEIDTPVYGNE